MKLLLTGFAPFEGQLKAKHINLQASTGVKYSDTHSIQASLRFTFLLFT